MCGQELDLHRAAEGRLPIRRHCTAICAIPPQNKDSHAPVAALRNRTRQQFLMELRKVLANTILHLLTPVHLERLQHRAHCRRSRTNRLGNLRRIAADEATGDVAQFLRTAESLLQFQHLAVPHPFAETGHH
ncbi:hypothetical protein D3C81_1000780 [compost metagenome]